VAITLRFEEHALREGQRIAALQHRSFNGFMASLLEQGIKDYQRRQARRSRAGGLAQTGQEESGDGR